MFNKVSLVFVLVAVVFVIIALPTFLCGCHPNIQPDCLRYHLVNSSVVGHRIDTTTCSECVAYSQSCSQSCTGSGNDQTCSQTCTNVCSHYRYYDCYYSYAIFIYQLEGDEEYRACDINVVAASEDRNYANNKLEETYPIGFTTIMYVDKLELKCFTETNVQALAITGLVFFCLAGLFVILAVIWQLFC